MPKTAAAPAVTHPLISDRRLGQLYVTLLNGQALRKQLKRRQRPAPLVATEAIVTGTVTHLGDNDALMAAPGDRLAALARGYSQRKVLSGAALKGILPAGSTVETSFAIATGYALAHQEKRDEKQRITLAFSGPGVTTLDGLAPSMAFAAANKLGIIFVIETAADADVSGPRHTHTLGLPGIPVDGNDVIAVYRVAQEAVTRARRGGGPTLIDCKPWPLDRKCDPVRRLEEALARRGIFSVALRKRAGSPLKS